jgi:putative oxidoreductase
VRRRLGIWRKKAESLKREAAMESVLGRYSRLLYSLMRLMAGAAFACHGAQKLFGLFGGTAATGKPIFLAAGVIEFLGGTLIALGLFAGYAGFVASGEMAWAYFTVHAPNGFWPIVNKGELAVVYCFVFLYIASQGSGAISLERLFRAPRRS